MSTLKKTLWENIRREFKFSIARFISVTTLIALGVFVLIGLKSTGPDMRKTANSYYEQQNMADAVITSNSDISKADQNYFKTLAHIKKIEFSTYQDAVIKHTNKTVRLNSKATSLSTSKVVKGRLPRSDHEIALSKQEMSKYQIGDTISFVNNKGQSQISGLNHTSYKIVGFVTSPDYLKKTNMGQTEAGDGQIATYGVLSKSAFTVTTPKLVKISYNNVTGNSYSNGYEQKVQKNVDAAFDQIRNRGTKRTRQEKQNQLAQLATASKKLAQEQAELNVKKTSLATSQEQLETHIKNQTNPQIKNQLEQNYATIKENKTALAQSQAKINEATNELNSKHQRLENSTQQIIYSIKSRNDYNNGYNQFGENAKRIDVLSNTFPIIFFLVALLVCFITMSRMANEKRTELGILRALGYSKFDTLKIFIVYGLLTGIIGSVIGVILGTSFLPTKIFTAYSINFSIPNLQTPVHWLWVIVAALISIIVTSLPALYIAGRSLKELPATLMLPKPPKSGTKVLLEKIPFFWRHISFNYKIMIRNLARYKNRMFMTIIGVASCTALLITGFGIGDSLSGILENQYQKIVHYDVISVYNPEASSTQLANYKKIVDDQKNIKSKTTVYYQQVTTRPQGEINDQTITMLVPQKPTKFSTYVTLNNAKTQQKVALPNHGVAISRKLASVTHKNVGDTLVIKDTTGQTRRVQVSKIIEMYAGHNIYMSPAYYKQVFNKSVVYNATMLRLHNRSSNNIDRVSQNINKTSAAVTAVQADNEKIEINNVLHGLSNLVLIITVAASALAFVVLFTLTNINVSERIRELSTIKVLGFYPKEVILYVYRETFFLTATGILFGWLSGNYLHRYIMQTLPPESVMTPLGLVWTNPAISATLTFVFSLIVMMIMARKINRIDMLEALKSVD